MMSPKLICVRQRKSWTAILRNAHRTRIVEGKFLSKIKENRYERCDFLPQPWLKPFARGAWTSKRPRCRVRHYRISQNAAESRDARTDNRDARLSSRRFGPQGYTFRRTEATGRGLHHHGGGDRPPAE